MKKDGSCLNQLQTLRAVSWQWLRLGNVKKNTEATITAAQDQALRTSWIKLNMDGVNCPLPFLEYASLLMSHPYTNS